MSRTSKRGTTRVYVEYKSIQWLVISVPWKALIYEGKNTYLKIPLYNKHKKNRSLLRWAFSKYRKCVK